MLTRGAGHKQSNQGEMPFGLFWLAHQPSFIIFKAHPEHISVMRRAKFPQDASAPQGVQSRSTLRPRKAFRLTLVPKLPNNVDMLGILQGNIL